MTPTRPRSWPRVGSRRGVHAAFTLRRGGVSAAPFDSLNLGTHVGDAAGAVAENRRRVGAALALPSEPLWLEQVHGTGSCSMRKVAARGTPADAIVSRRPGIVAAIQVADCLPVLFAARDGAAVAAAHAGWRGLGRRDHGGNTREAWDARGALWSPGSVLR